MSDSAAGSANRSPAKLVLAVALILLAIWMIWARVDKKPDDPSQSRVKAPEVDVPSNLSSVADSDRELREGRRQVETTKVFASKDPFKPLVDTESVAMTKPRVSSTPSTGGRNESTAFAKGDRSSESRGEQSRTKAGATVHVVQVVDGASARVQIDGTTYEPRKGQLFANNFKLISLKRDCTTMLYGDEQFTLCVGEEAVK
jgi:hypothetical protein